MKKIFVKLLIFIFLFSACHEKSSRFRSAQKNKKVLQSDCSLKLTESNNIDNPMGTLSCLDLKYLKLERFSVAKEKPLQQVDRLFLEIMGKTNDQWGWIKYKIKAVNETDEYRGGKDDITPFEASSSSEFITRVPDLPNGTYKITAFPCNCNGCREDLSQFKYYKETEQKKEKNKAAEKIINRCNMLSRKIKREVKKLNRLSISLKMHY